MPRTLPLLCVVLALAGALGACAPEDRDARLDAVVRWEDRRLAPVDSLTDLATGPDAHVRRAALRAAGRIGRTDAVPALLAGLEDRSLAVRSQAAFSLGLLGGDVGVGALGEALGSAHPNLRRAACQGLAHQEHDGTLLLGPAVSARERVATAAWTALRRVADRVPPDSLLAALRAGLGRPEAAVRWRVLRCAERAPDSTLVAQIAPLATADAVAVRVHALRALARHEGPAALAAVLRSGDQHGRLRGRDLRRVRIHELRAVGRLAGPTLAADPEGEHDSPAGRATARLRAGSESGDPHVAETALRAMARAVAGIGLPPAAASQESLLPVWRLRLVRAARARLEDPVPAVRAAAVAALGALRGRGADATLRALLADADPATAGAALTALLGHDPGHRAACAALDTVIARHGDRGHAVVMAALPALLDDLAAAGALHWPPERFPRQDDPACRPSLVWWRAAAGLRHPDVAVRAQAAPLLARLPGRASRAAVLTAWQREPGQPGGPRREVQRALLEAVAALWDPALADTADFVPRCAECQFFARAAADSAAAARVAVVTDPAAADGDSLRALAADLLRAGFDRPDLALRLAAREAALGTGLLPDHLIPAAASLRETLPPHRRDPAQPPRTRQPAASEVVCVTDRGAFTIALATDGAPNACAALLGQIARGLHDGLTFHRVVPDFVAQGGCPRGDGWGGPGYTVRSEWTRAPFRRGTVGLAHAGKDTGGSQWFVCLSDQPHLDGRYTVLGRVTDGMEVVDRLVRGDRYRLEVAGQTAPADTASAGGV